METVKESILCAIEKMHKLQKDRKNIKQEEIKNDIAIANATSNLAKTYIAAIVLEKRIDQSKNQNKILLGEL